MSKLDHDNFLGQSIFFEMVCESGPRQRVLARAALALANEADDLPVHFAEILGSLHWNEYHTLLAMMAIRSSRILHWSKDDLDALKNWAL